ncbi:MAG: acyl-CoA dehydrogenase [Acidimicrobiales bacterium]
MSLAVTDDHLALAQAVARFASDRGLVDTARAVADAEEGDDALTGPFAELAQLGWLALHLPESAGGSGFGLAEAAVVIEELGRACAPGRGSPTMIASAVVHRLGGDGHPDLPGLADGSSTGTVAVGAQPLTRDGNVVSGPLEAVILGARVDLIVAPVAGPDGAVEWVILEAAQVSAAPVTSVDLTRPVATVAVEGAEVDAARWLGSGPADEIIALLLSAEAVGAASWCVGETARYATERVQFGRPIGQFQAVKHRCADMLADLELSRAAVWDACRGGSADEEQLAIAAAAALAPDAAYRIAKDCVQLHGGIGFTWEHDAHLFLRRVMATRSLLPDAHHWRPMLTAAVADGVSRDLPVELPAEADQVRADLRVWVESLVERPKREWNDVIVADGYLVPHWPAPYGRDADPVEQLVVDQEFRAAGIGRRHLQVAAWALPTVIEHGTDEQKHRWVGPSMRGEITWCQLFSEPEAGSDLASLRTRAERGDGGWLLTGQKVWTSMAHTAQWGICLARTNPDAPKHDGITCFFVDMASPGIDIRPLRELTGDAWFNEVFFDDVFVPDDCVIGEVNDGWRAGRTTLANERVSMGSGASVGAGLRPLMALAGPTPSPFVIDDLGDLAATELALGAMRTRMTLRALNGADAGPEASVVKLLGVIHDQRTQEVAVELLGAAGVVNDGAAAGWIHAFLWNRCLTIAGGTSEIQRNVIGERLLGLPRDP